MNDLPHELRYKPIPLVALVGASTAFAAALEKNTSVTVQESSRSVPIFRYLPTTHKEINITARTDKDSKQIDYQPDGILASAWILAASHQIPSAVVFVIDWDYPDCKINEFTNFGIIDSLRKKSQLESKSILPFIKDDFVPSMQSFEAAMRKASMDYYNDEIKYLKRRKEKLSKSTHSKLFVRASFKLGYYSELGNDITNAVKHYSSAYIHLREVKKNWKDFEEIKVVAEVINFRLCYLHLERSMHNLATSQFHQHVNYYRSLIGDPDREFQHYAWVSRQYQLFGELLQIFGHLTATSSPSSTPNASPKVTTNLNEARSKGWNHPGYYFQAAGNFESTRRNAAVKICYPMRHKETIVSMLEYVKPYKSSVIDLSKNGFIGQRVDVAALDEVKLSKLQVDPSTFMETFLSHPYEVVVAQELLVNHSVMIVNLLETAQQHYRWDHTATDRTLWYLMSQIGSEAFLSGDFHLAKLNNDQVVGHYRREKWWTLLSPCLKANLQCAVHLRQWDDVCRNCIELLSPNLPSSLDDKKDVLFLVLKVLDIHKLDSNLITTALDALAHELTTNTQIDGTKNTILSESSKLTKSSASIEAAAHPSLVQDPIVYLQLNNKSSLVKCHVQFEQASASIHSEVKFSVTLQSLFPAPVRFDCLKISFTNSEFDQELVDPHDASTEVDLWTATRDGNAKLNALASQSNNLIFLPGKRKLFHFTVLFKKVTRIQCTGALLSLGKVPSVLELKWDWTSQKVLHLVHARGQQRKMMDRSTIEILEHEPKIDLQIEHESPALVGEHYPIIIKIVNSEDLILSGVISIAPHISNTQPGSTSTPTPQSTGSALAIQVPTAVPEASHGQVQGNSLVQVTSHFESETGSTSGNLHAIKFGSIDSHKELHQLVRFVPPRQKIDEDYFFTVTVTYETRGYSTTMEKLLKVPVRTPFKIQFEVYDNELREITPSPVTLAFRKDKVEPIRLPTTSNTLPSTSPNTLSSITLNAARVPLGTLFYLRVEVHNNTNYPIQVDSLDLLPHSSHSVAALHHQNVGYLNVTHASTGGSSQHKMQPTLLSKGNKYSVWFALRSVGPMSHSLGTFVVDWARITDFVTSRPVSTKWASSAPVIYSESPTFTTRIECPERGTLGTPMMHSLFITNNTDGVLAVALEVEDSTFFAVAGDKKAQFRVNASSVLQINHTLVPIKVGALKCPSLLVKQLENDGSGLGPNGIMEQPYLSLNHPHVFIDPVQLSPLLV